MHPSELLAEAQKYHQNNQLPEARSRYQLILDAEPENPGALYGLAVIASQSGDNDTAEHYIRRVISLVPGDAHLLNTLATIKRAQGDAGSAINNYQQALQLAPGNLDALIGMGALYRDTGNFSAAIDCYRQAVTGHPEDVNAWSNLGNACWQLEQHEEATNAFREAVRFKPDQAYTHLNLGNALREQGYHEEAVACYRRAAEISHTAGAIIRAQTTIPVIVQSCQQIEETRNQLRGNLEKLIDSKLSISDPIREIGKTNFFLAYHGADDRELQSLFATLYSKTCPDLNWTAPHCNDTALAKQGSKIRIGFISRYFKNHSIARTSSGIIAGLPREHFHVMAIFLEPPMDEMAHTIAQAADETVVIPNDISGARMVLSEKRLDILYYQDIGMDIFTYFLAFARLAPVQCTSFGHPVTSGIPNIDYYISTAAWEPENGASHYSEKLLLLENATAVAYYEKPALPETLLLHDHFGLDPARNIYICPQALFKFHPDFDAILGGILSVDPDGQLVLIEGKHPHWTSLIKARLSAVAPDAVNRVRFLPRLRSIEFINLIAISDVMLDTVHFCGFNTSLEAFAAGTPVVTLQGEFMRSRHTAAFYRKMQIDDCIAANPQEYIDIAVRLGTDPEYRAEVSNRITLASELLWKEEAVFEDMAKAFTTMTAERLTH